MSAQHISEQHGNHRRLLHFRGRLASGLLVFALIGAACSSSSVVDVTETSATTDSESSQTDQADSTNSADSAAPETVDDEVADDEETETPTDEAEPVVPEIADEPGLPMADGVDIAQLTAKSGGGVRPMLAWSPVDAAASYSVVVYDAQGAPWWSWSGADTEVVIGGVATDAEIGGPRADAGVRWIVMAFNDQGDLVGTSPKRSVEP